MANVTSIDVLETTVRSLHTVRYAELSSTTIMLFDHLMTIDLEVELIWQASWTLGKFLFILNRYHGLAILIFNNYALFASRLTDSFCLVWFRWQGSVGVIMCMTTEVVLQFRLYALYFLSKKVLLLVFTTFFFVSVASATMMGAFLAEISVVSYNLDGVSFCVAKNITGHFYAFWIPILFYETFLCGLALLRGWHNFQSAPLSIFFSGRWVFETLIRDSVLYFLIIFVTYLVNLVLFAKPSNLVEVPIGFAVAMSCVMGNRLLLNVRETVWKPNPSDIDLSDPLFQISSRQLLSFELEELRTPRCRDSDDLPTV